MNAISLSHLEKSFGPQAVLRDLSCEIAAGQVVGLLGRNGTGKTTLLRTLYGLLPADGGTISLLGLDPQRNATDLRLKVGFLTESCHLYPWMTGSQLAAFLTPFYPTWNADAFATDCRRLEVPLQQKVGQMSKGTQRKLMLALTLAPAPELLLLDEPLAGLDPVMRDQIRDTIIGNLADRGGTTIVLSSHEIDEIAPLCDRILMLGDARLILDADKNELLQKTRRVTVTFENPVEAIPTHPTILAAAPQGCQVQLVVRDYSEESVRALLANFKVRDLRADGLSLREIFVACADRKEVRS